MKRRNKKGDSKDERVCLLSSIHSYTDARARALKRLIASKGNPTDKHLYSTISSGGKRSRCEFGKYKIHVLTLGFWAAAPHFQEAKCINTLKIFCGAVPSASRPSGEFFSKKKLNIKTEGGAIWKGVFVVVNPITDKVMRTYRFLQANFRDDRISCRKKVRHIICMRCKKKKVLKNSEYS